MFHALYLVSLGLYVLIGFVVLLYSLRTMRRDKIMDLFVLFFLTLGEFFFSLALGLNLVFATVWAVAFGFNLIVLVVRLINYRP